MRKRPAVGVLGLLSLSATVLVSGQGRPGLPPLADRIAHTDPARYRSSPAVHGGPGTLDFFALFNADAIDANLQFLHRGVIQPKSGIGQHFHNYCEEMFIILDGEAQFTVDGRTSTLKGRLGKTKAFANIGTTPLEFLVVGVARDMNKKTDLLSTPPLRFGGPGRGRGL
jgi:mannose-6-phosphate isomerase-like protein (cupin superfamily)